MPFLVSEEGREELHAGLERHERTLSPLDKYKTAWICHEIFIAVGDDYEPHSWHERVVDGANRRYHSEREFVDAFGRPNADGVYLVRVIEFSDDSNEDGWTYASMMVSTALANAARDLGYPADQVSVADSFDTAQTVTLPDGITIHAYACQVPRTKPWYRESRPPTGEELARWAGRQPRPQ